MANAVAYGFIGEQHVFRERVSSVGTDVIWQWVRDSATFWNGDVNAMLAGWAERSIESQARIYWQKTNTLQPLDDKGNPYPVQFEGYNDMAWPLQGGGYAWGNNRISREKMTVDEVNRWTIGFQQADADWIMRHLFAAIFTNVNYTFADPEKGNLTIKPLANGDGDLFPGRNGLLATDTHYLAQLNAIDNSNNPFDDIYDELAEHPINNVSATNPVVVYVPRNLKASIEALSAFTPIDEWFVKVGVNTEVLSPSAARFGSMGELIGVANNVIIRLFDRLPNDYMIAHALGAGPICRMREHEETALQGIISEEHSVDGNTQEFRLIRYAGFGVVNRVSALAYRIGNASYAIPAGYTAPLAV